MEEIINLLKSSNLKQVSRDTNIPYDRMYKWVAGKGSPKTSDTVTLTEYFIKNGLLSKIDGKNSHSGEEIPNLILRQPETIYKRTQLTEESNTLLIGEVPGPGEETNMLPLGNNKYGMIVPLIPIKAYAGYLDNFGNQEFYEQLDKHNVTVIGNFRGRYFAFVVKGESMENWTSEELSRKSIPEGTIVTGREIPHHHWRNKLHLHRFQMYVIVHNDGIITKEIIEHNTEFGYIICHSLNPDKNEYPDRKIMLDDCKQILNIVDKSLPI